MVRTKKILSVILAIMMLMQTFVITNFAADIEGFTDFPTNSWSTEAMTAAVENGLLVGTSETTIEPQKNLTRAEFAAIVTRAFGATKTADISKFKDVDENDWFYGSVAKVVQMGVMNGTSDTTFAPNAFMKREDVILALARVLFVNGDDTSVLDQFSDKAKIDNWSVKAIAGMVAEDYVHGYEDGTIRPQNYITREELAQLFHNIFKTYISEDGEYDSVAKKGSVIVRSEYVTLKDVTIDGDLIMADGVGEGDFRISDVHVTGKIIARGGEGMNYFVNVTSDGKVIVNDPNGVVNFYNYREEDNPFKGGNVIENTPATFLERKTPTTPSIGGGTTYKITFKDVDGNDLKTVTKTNKNYVIADSDVPTDAQMAEDGYIFKGWSTDKNATSGESRDYFIDKKIGDVKGTWYPIYVEGYEVVFYADDTVGSPVKTETGVVEASYVIQNSDVPADVDMEKAGFEFQGWSQMGSVEVKNRIYFVGKTASEVKGEWYPVYVKLTVYKVSFKYNDGTDALAAVEKTLKPSEDYVLTSADVKDVAHPTAPADYKFLGWSEAGSSVVLTSAELEVSIRDLDGKTYYAQFEKVTDNYTVVFKYTDGTEINKVEKTLSASENYVLTSADVDDVDYHTNPADYKFLGWTDTVSGTDYKTSAELQVSIKDLDGKTYYAQFERAETTYSVSFKYEDGTEALPTVEKNLVASEDYVLTNADVKDVAHPTAPADYKFLGWSEAGSSVVLTSAELEVSIRDLDGKTYYAQFEKVTDNYTVVFKYTDGTEINKVEKTLSASENYVLTSADVDDVDYHTNPADYTFLGWTETISGTDYKTSAELQVSIKDLDGKTFYAQFERAETTYSVSFKYEDGTEALPTVEKSLVASEDYVLTNADVKDVAHPTAPADYKFLGWSEAGSAVVVSSADLEKSIRDLDGKTYYAQFEKISDVYTIIFKDNDENDLATLTKNEDESIVDSEIPAVSVDASSLFKGWATTKGATTVEFDNTVLVSDVVANVFTSTTVTLYPVIVPKDAVEYFIEHYFQDLDGNYVLDSAKTQNGFEIPGKTVTATALTVEHYEENLTHADRLAKGIVPDAPEVLTLKFFYDLEVLKVNYYDLAVDEEYPVLVYDVKYGGTIDNYCYEDTAFDEADNEAIKAEIENYIEFLTVLGYGKSYDDKYLYNEFEPKDTDGDGVADEYDYAYPIDYYDFDHDHEINFKWYVEDDEEDYVVFDEEHVFYEDLDLFSKVKKLNVVISFPEELVGDEVLTLNVPYEESTRFLDSVRDALYLNDNIATYPETTGMEEKMYDKLSTVGGKFFDGDGVFNDEQEINNTDVMVYFYQLMGGKSEYRRWLWNEVEHSLADTLREDPAIEDMYWTLRNTLASTDEAALKLFFEDNYYGLDFASLYSVAYDKYVDSKNFIYDSSENDQFIVTENNLFIMPLVRNKISSLSTVDAILNSEEYGKGKIPQGLLNRLPMDLIKKGFETRIKYLIDSLDSAVEAAENGEPEENRKVNSGILIDVNIVGEVLMPFAKFALEKHEGLVDAAAGSDNRAAKIFHKYYGLNPYGSALVPTYGQLDKYFESNGRTDTDLADKYGYLDDLGSQSGYNFKNEYSFNDLGKYSIKSFKDIYYDVLMPLSVESVDALLWLMDEDGGDVDFAQIKELALENKELVLALHNHPHKLMTKYAEEGLPEDMSQYWDDLLSDPEIKKAVEKIDGGFDFDMMYFVESKIQNATLEMYFIKVLNKVGVPAETLLGKYTDSKAYKELTEDDLIDLLEKLDKCWGDDEVEIDGSMTQIENYYGTTDYVFDNVLEKVGRSGNEAEAAFKGFEMTITRFFADTIDQVAP